jgi:hypothetical protein
MLEITHSESLIQDYLDRNGVVWEREPGLPGKAKRPDYLIHSEGRPCWLEVKEFDDPEVKPKGGFSPCPPISEKISRASKQFKEYKNDCCALVLHNCQSVYRSTQVHVVLSAAFGEFTELEQNAGVLQHDNPPRFRFRGRSCLTSGQNTTFSAILIIEHYELQERLADAFEELRQRHMRGDELRPFSFAEILQERNDIPNGISYPGSVRVKVLRNPFARHPLPEDLFRGAFDQHWGIEPHSDWFSLKWIGSELDKLRNRAVPVPFWLL